MTWTHYRILSRVENELARNFYISEAIDCHWDTRLLQRQIKIQIIPALGGGISG
ncbi:MAG: DUF1016 N-terminal domain-containing protein [Saprospiraceae bacterium]|nr:DUF1016 N-terminal domain-containing protein [Saprospiraceae bacterium]